MSAEPLRALFCGSRTYMEGEFIRFLMAGMNAEVEGDIVVIEGAAKGADSLAAFYARSHGFALESYPADWEFHGKRAGYIRNQQMLDEGKPDIVFAFVDKPLAESKGTAMMVELSRKAGIPVFVTQYIPGD